MDNFQLKNLQVFKWGKSAAAEAAAEVPIIQFKW